jgi:hypothetical protein
MSFVPKPTPTFGHPVKRAKPYIYATWLAKLLGGDACVWSAWFKAHYQHKKFETNAEQLQEWNRFGSRSYRPSAIVAGGFGGATSSISKAVEQGSPTGVRGKLLTSQWLRCKRFNRIRAASRAMPQRCAHARSDHFNSSASCNHSRDHTALMATVRRRLEENGWRVFVEDQNEFKLRGQVADVAGKADIIATMPGHLLVADGKTGKPRDSDWWQVVIYLFAVGLARPDLLATNGQPNEVEGEVVYYGKSIRIPLTEVSEERRDAIVRLVKVVGGATPPARAPSRRECERCTIGYADCPQRWREDQQPATAAVEAF